MSSHPSIYIVKEDGDWASFPVPSTSFLLWSCYCLISYSLMNFHLMVLFLSGGGA